MLPPVTAYSSQSSLQKFPLVTVLPSSASAIGQTILFGAFFGTVTMSDFSVACMSGFRPQTFPNRPANFLLSGTAEISRFSNIKCPRMLRVFDSVGSIYGSLRLSPLYRVAFPTEVRGRHPRRVISELDVWPAFPPVNASRAASRLPAHDSGS